MKISTLCLLLAVLSLAACKTGKSDDARRVAAQKIAGQYQGLTPCADCDGIEYLIVLQTDFTYLGAKVYRGKNEQPFALSGRWKFTADNRIELRDAPSPDYVYQFEIGENQIILLDRDGQRVTGELADRYILWKAGFEPAQPEGGDDPFAPKRAVGVDFIGLGTEPFWAIELDFDKNIRFTTADGDSLIAPAAAGQMRDGALHYETKTGAGELKIALRRETCSDGMSDRDYEYSVVVMVKGLEYKGCGVLLAGSLGSYWTLLSLNGAEPDGKAFMKGMPVLQMNVATNQYSGTDGCNQLNGAFVRNGAKIKFNPPAMTRMACPGDAPKQYLDALLAVTAYRIEGTKLTLSAEGKAVLVYGLL